MSPDYGPRDGTRYQSLESAREGLAEFDLTIR